MAHTRDGEINRKVPRVDHVRNVFSEPRPLMERLASYSGSWSEMIILLLPASLLSFAFWAQAPGSSKSLPTSGAATSAAQQGVAAPKPAASAVKPAAQAVKPAAAQAAKPAAVNPALKAAAAKAVAVAPKPKPALPGEPAVLTIGTEKLTKSQFEDLLASLPEQFKAQFASPQGRRTFAQQYGEMKAMAIEARKQMATDGKLRTQWQLQVDQALANAFMREAMTNAKVDAATLRKYYDEHKGEFETVNARHILIRFKGSGVPLKPGQADRTEEEALAMSNEIRKRLAAGEDFAEIARKESDDTGSGAAGGSLGDFGHGMMVPPFEQAAFSLPIGQVSDAVRSQFGYHIIQVQARKSKTYEESVAEIEKKVKPELGRKFVEEIKSRNAVVLDDAYFGKD